MGGANNMKPIETKNNKKESYDTHGCSIPMYDKIHYK